MDIQCTEEFALSLQKSDDRHYIDVFSNFVRLLSESVTDVKDVERLQGVSRLHKNSDTFFQAEMIIGFRAIFSVNENVVVFYAKSFGILPTSPYLTSGAKSEPQPLDFTVKWFDVYWDIAKKLLNIYKQKGNSANSDLLLNYTSNLSLGEENDWLLRLREDLYTMDKTGEKELVGGLDPIHIFASFNDSKLSDEQRLERINAFCKAFELPRYSNIDFSGCPMPIVRSTLNVRVHEVQQNIWAMFCAVLEHGQLAKLSFSELDNWYGVAVPVFTMFLFWIKGYHFLSLDKNTLGFLMANSVLGRLPKSYEEYRELLVLGPSAKYRALVELVVVGPPSIRLITLGKSGLVDMERISETELADWLQEIISKNKGDTKLVDVKQIPEQDLASENAVSVDTDDVLQETNDSQISLPEEEDLTLSSAPPADTQQATSSLIKSDLGFSIIALRINQECAKEHVKALKKDTLYQLDKAFEISPDREVRKIAKSIALLYSEKELDISISGIVGKNGTGKSTLAELLYLVFNNIICLINKGIDGNQASFDYVDGLDIELYVQMGRLFRIDVKNDVIQVFPYELYQSANEHTDHVGEAFRPSKPLELNEFPAEHLFYNVVINYSQHGLNAGHNGRSWLEPHFQDQDVYQNPMLIEPRRKQGNIDINQQDSLAKQRLLSNLLLPDDQDYSFRQISETLKAEKLRFRISIAVFEDFFKKFGSKEPHSRLHWLNERIPEVIQRTFEYFDIKHPALSSEEVVQAASSYTVHNYAQMFIFLELVNIAQHFEAYKKYLSDDDKILTDIDEYLSELTADNSHVTYKLHQTLNFLRYPDRALYKADAKDCTLTLDELALEIVEIDRTGGNTIYYIPPAFFDIDIVLEQDISFDHLSSGEKQKIYTINALVYHLTNLESVASVSSQYRYVNMLLDEVELYFHPELQRRFIDDLLKALKKVEVNSIRGINIVFITHSPFILSDIPANNVLFLDKETPDEPGKPKTGNASIPSTDKSIQSFGANIHELLMRGFFLDSSIGQFAEQLISDFFTFHRKVVNAGENGLSDLLQEFKEQREIWNLLTEVIAEEYLQSVVKRKLEDIEKKLTDPKDFNRSQQARLRRELEKLQAQEKAMEGNG